MSERTDHELAEVPQLTRYVPPFSSYSGYHWIRRFRGGPAIPLYWNAVWHQNNAEGWGRWAQPDREGAWEYCGPCPSPDDPPLANPAMPKTFSFRCPVCTRHVLDGDCADDHCPLGEGAQPIPGADAEPSTGDAKHDGRPDRPNREFDSPDRGHFYECPDCGKDLAETDPPHQCQSPWLRDETDHVKFSTAWEREDYLRRKRGEPE